MPYNGPRSCLCYIFGFPLYDSGNLDLYMLFVPKPITIALKLSQNQYLGKVFDFGVLLFSIGSN